MNEENYTNTFEWHQRFWSIIIKRWVATAPLALYEYQDKLNLSASEVWFIMYILSFKWDNNFPYPSLTKIAKKSWVSRVTLHKYVNSLVEKQYLKVINRSNPEWWQTSNAYDFTELFRKIEEFIIEDDNNNNGVCNSISDSREVNRGVLNNFTGGDKNINTPRLNNFTGGDKKLNTNNKTDNNNIKNKQQQEVLLLLENLNFKKKNITEILDSYELWRIEEVVLEYQRNDKKIENWEWWILNALKWWWDFPNPEKEKIEKRKKQEDETKKQLQEEELNNKREEEISQRIGEWKLNNPDKYEEIKIEEWNKLIEKGGVASKSDLLLNISIQMRIRKDILGLD